MKFGYVVNRKMSNCFCESESFICQSYYVKHFENFVQL